MEMFGFRLNNGRIQTRNSSAVGDTNFDCDAGNWADLTGAEVRVSALQFSIAQSQAEVATLDIEDADALCADGQPCLCAREVRIGLTANLANAPLVERSLHRTVQVQNEKFVASFDSAYPCMD
jgi:hypothetical protein